MLGIFPFPTLIQFTVFLVGIQHCVTIVGKWVFDRNITFVLYLNFGVIEKIYANYCESKGGNGNKEVLKHIRFSPI